MKKIITIIISLITCMALIVGGILLINSINVNKNSETKNYIVDKPYNKIEIDTYIDDINIYLSTNNETKVTYVENNLFKYEIKVIDNTLSIKQIKMKKSLFNLKNNKLDIYLTNEIIELLDIEGSTSDININQGLTFNNLEIENSTGNININSTVQNNIDIELSTGDLKLENSSFGNTNIEATTGDIKLLNMTCKLLDIETTTGDIELSNTNCDALNVEITTGKTKLINTIVTNDLHIDGSIGDVILDAFDAKNINIKLTTGDVKGTILTSKFFIVKSNTGKEEVPETREGGECRITATTGDIIISYK